jgi:hypothetical protein
MMIQAVTIPNYNPNLLVLGYGAADLRLVYTPLYLNMPCSQPKFFVGFCYE